jgi:uncharacterized protein YndB with AHSA1/START domain
VAEKLIEKNESTADRELVFMRVFDAPRRMVWEAWTDPKQVALWWGPKGFTTTIDEMDVRPGGVWKLVMHGPDGTDYPNKSIFTDVVPNERLRFRLSGGKQGGPAAQFEMTATFEDDGDKTRLTMRLVFASTEARYENVREYGSIEGARQTLERLAEHLSTMPFGERADKGKQGGTR